MLLSLCDARIAHLVGVSGDNNVGLFPDFGDLKNPSTKIPSPNCNHLRKIRAFSPGRTLSAEVVAHTFPASPKARKSLT